MGEPNPFAQDGGLEDQVVDSIAPIVSAAVASLTGGGSAGVPDFDAAAPGIQDRVRQLQQREADLLRRRNLLEQAGTSEVVGYLAPNYPSWFPLIHVADVAGAPLLAKEAMQMALNALTILFVAVFFNCFAIVLIRSLPGYKKGRNLILALLQGFGMVYGNLNLSYEPLYRAVKKRAIPFRYVLVQMGLVVCCGYLTLGFPRSGSVGIATVLDLVAISRSAFSVIIGIINTCLMGGATVLQVMALNAVQRYDKQSGVVAAEQELPPL